MREFLFTMTYTKQSYHNAIIIIETRNLHTVPQIPAACQKGITWNPQSYRLFRFGFIL